MKSLTWSSAKFALVLSGLFSFIWPSSSSSLAAVVHVDVNSTNPTPPYTNWATAATVIQDAVDAANAGDTVLVTNGIYSTGDRQLNVGDVTNRVALTNGAILRSVNGPSVTFIRGYQVPDIASITNAVRCVQMANNSVLSGFTLTNGSSGTGNYSYAGGGALCTYGDHGSITPGIISNCVFIGNYASGTGGGTMSGTLINCLLVGNYAPMGGAAGYSALINCVITNNSAGEGGGIDSCRATNCLIAFNIATNVGGGSAFSRLVNCTVVSNVSRGNVGGSYNDEVMNSILIGNTATATNNTVNYGRSSIGHSCTTPFPGGNSNFTNAPLFVNPLAGDFRLQSNSPCISAGINARITTPTDLDSNPRIRGGTVDVGAYEFQNPTSIIAYYWLQNFGLPTDGSADFADPDNDGMSNWSEWRAGTDPTNSLSVFKLAISAVDSSGITLTWPSANGILYNLQRATDLSAKPAFHSVQSNIFGQGNTGSYKDSTATGKGPYFYRVGVQ